METASAAAPASGRRLRIATVYRNFDERGSIHSLYRRNAERLARDEDVTAFCSARTRESTSAPVRFEDVEPLLSGQGRFKYALECATFARAATRKVARLRDRFDVVHVEGFSATQADLVTAHAVRPAELEHYFERIEPNAWLRRHLSPRYFRPQARVVLAIERKLFRRPWPLVLAPTTRIAQDLESWYGVPRDRVEVLPFGIETARFGHDPAARAALRAALGLEKNRLAVLFVGDDFPRKGLDRALEGLAASRSDSVLWVAGSGDTGPPQRLAASLGVADRVRFLGRQSSPELQGWYSACDVVLLPSRQDSWGHTVIEGLAAGRVVVASEYVGAHETIEDGRSGYVLRERGSVAAQIAVLINGPLADPARRAAIGAAGERTAGAYDHEAIYPRFREAHYRAHELRLSQLSDGRARRFPTDPRPTPVGARVTD